VSTYSLRRKEVLSGAGFEPNQCHTRETVLGVWFTITTGYTLILLLDILHIILAALFMNILRIDILEDWPDLFGSPMEAFILRRFWSRSAPSNNSSVEY
jgi:hypothetical protein